MALEEYYCGCGRKTEDRGLCERCADRWDQEKDRIREYVESNHLDYDDQQKLETKSWNRMGLGSRIVRYCDYGGSCGNLLDDTEEYCSSCVARQERYEREEEERRARAVDDY
jgi:hypothetical protein